MGGRVGRRRTASLASSGLFHDHWYEVGHRPCGGPGVRPRAGPTASARPSLGAAMHRLHTADCDERQVDGPSEPNRPPVASTAASTTGLFACAATPAGRAGLFACATGSAGLRPLRELKKSLRWSVRLSRSGKLTVREDAPRGFLSSSVDFGRPRGLTGFSWRSVVTNKAAPSIVPSTSTSVVQKQRQQRPVPSSTMASPAFAKRE